MDKTLRGGAGVISLPKSLTKIFGIQIGGDGIKLKKVTTRMSYPGNCLWKRHDAMNKICYYHLTYIWSSSFLCVYLW